MLRRLTLMMGRWTSERSRWLRLLRLTHRMKLEELQVQGHTTLKEWLEWRLRWGGSWCSSTAWKWTMTMTTTLSWAIVSYRLRLSWALSTALILRLHKSRPVSLT